MGMRAVGWIPDVRYARWTCQVPVCNRRCRRATAHLACRERSLALLWPESERLWGPGDCLHPIAEPVASRVRRTQGIRSRRKRIGEFHVGSRSWFHYRKQLKESGLRGFMLAPGMSHRKFEGYIKGCSGTPQSQRGLGKVGLAPERIERRTVGPLRLAQHYGRTLMPRSFLLHLLFDRILPGRLARSE